MGTAELKGPAPFPTLIQTKLNYVTHMISSVKMIERNVWWT